jgi:hypothetical protein
MAWSGRVGPVPVTTVLVFGLLSGGAWVLT